MEHFKSPFSEFANDLYDVLAMNKHFRTQDEFFNKYVDNSDAFMLEEHPGGCSASIYFDDYTVTITPKR